MAIRQYRCIVTALKIRSQPSLNPATQTGQTLQRNEVITAEDARRVDAEGYTWVQHSRGWTVERSLDGRFIFLTDGVPARERIWGINIDPNNPQANPPARRLTGSGWVRFAFHVDSRRESLAQAFAFYDPIIRDYVYNGTKVILILLQDTFLGNLPWTNGDWNGYIPGFAARAAQIAAHYRGVVSVYQIWNEMDTSGAETSHFIAPEVYADLLRRTNQAIKQADPAATVIAGGVASGVTNGIDYLRAVRSANNGQIPADGIAMHPYGLVPPNVPSPFAGWVPGTMDSAFRQITDVFPGLPLYITEVGVARVNVEDQSLWPRIANYMDSVIDFIRQSYNHAIPAVIWFAWSDPMDRAGIVTANGEAKGPIFTAFFQNVHQDYPSVTRAETPYSGKISLAHVAGEPLPDANLGALVARVTANAPNLRNLIVRCSAGTSFISNGELGISTAADLTRWATALSAARLSLITWHEVQGANLTGEVGMINQVALAPGVRSILLEANAAVLALRDTNAIRAFMMNVRRVLPGAVHVGLSFDGRPQTYPSILLNEWVPFVDSLHPRLFWRDWGQRPAALVNAAMTALATFRKPMVPIIQGGTDADLREGARAAMDANGAYGVTVWRLSGQDLFNVRGLYAPWLAGYTPIPALGTFTVRTSGTLRIRAVPSDQGEVLGQLRPGEMVTGLERRSVPPFEWIRHSRGWTASRNTATNEFFLS